MEKPTISVPIDILRSMLDAMEVSGHLHWCETCGAWMDEADEALARVDGFETCWKVVTENARWEGCCRSERGAIIDELKMLERPTASSLPVE
jgi:hypothetical protein